MRNKLRKLLIYLIIFLSLNIPDKSFSENSFVVIINKSNPLSSINMEELRSIFKMERKFWKDGKKIVLGLISYKDERSKIFNKLVYKMDEGALKKFWFNKIFKGQLTSTPITLDNLEESIKFVQNNPGAISYTNKSNNIDSVKVLSVNGFPDATSIVKKDNLPDSVKILIVNNFSW
jgi:ABC-type phosphate transport system substrate-binding protein